jgi:Raf kinase inhibitor-like YbhB/YbcL family protein
MWLKLLVVVIAIAMVPAGTTAAGAPRPPKQARSGAGRSKEVRMSLRLTSPSFKDREEIPKKHTCEAEDVSPALAWSSTPAGTKSFALIVDDPDAPSPAAPMMTWVHWVLYNIPAQVDSLGEAMTSKTLPAGTLEGLNGWKQSGYRGPCPPIGRHRYFHKLYALDTVLPDLHRPAKAALEKAMEGHVLARAELVGTYQKSAAR